MKDMIAIHNGGDPVYGRYEVGSDVNLATIYLVSSILSNKEVTLTSVPHSSYISKACELVEFVGGNCRVNNNEVVVYVPEVRTHAIPSSIYLPFMYKWIAVMAILARAGRSGLEYSKLSKDDYVIVRGYAANLEKYGFVVEDDGEYLLLSKPNRQFSEGIVYDLSEREPVEIIGILLLASSSEKVNHTLMNVPWSYCAFGLYQFIQALGVEVDEQNELYIFKQSNYQEVRYTIPASIVEGLIVALMPVINGGDVEILKVHKSQWVPVLSVFNKLGVSYKIEGDTLRVWGGSKQPEADYSIELSVGVFPALSREALALLVMLPLKLGMTFTVEDEIWPNGLLIANDLIPLGIEFSVVKEKKSSADKTILSKIKVLGRKQDTPNTLTIDSFKTPELALLYSLVFGKYTELSGIGILDTLYPGIFEKFDSIGIRITEIGS